jgi:hypothetical protein
MKTLICLRLSVSIEGQVDVHMLLDANTRPLCLHNDVQPLTVTQTLP